MQTDVPCPECNQNMTFATAALDSPDAAPLICGQCHRGYWPSEVRGGARLPDIKADQALWSELRGSAGKRSDADLRRVLARLVERVR